MDVYAEANGQYIRSTLNVAKFEREVLLKSLGHSFQEGSVSTDAYFGEPELPEDETAPGVPPGRQGAYLHLDLTDNSSFRLEPGGKYRLTLEGPLE